MRGGSRPPWVPALLPTGWAILLSPLAMLHHDLLFCMLAIVLAELSLLSRPRAGAWLSLLAYLLCMSGVVDGVE